MFYVKFQKEGGSKDRIKVYDSSVEYATLAVGSPLSECIAKTISVYEDNGCKVVGIYESWGHYNDMKSVMVWLTDKS